MWVSACKGVSSRGKSPWNALSVRLRSRPLDSWSRREAERGGFGLQNENVTWRPSNGSPPRTQSDLPVETTPASG